MEATNVKKLSEDMTFLREVVRESGRTQCRSIALAVLWAVIIGTGYALLDFNLRAAMWFWGIAPAVGFIASFGMGRRGELLCGVERGRGLTYPLHWGSMFVIALAILMISHSGNLPGKAIGQLFTLTSGVVAYLAGLHLDRRFLLPGVILVLGAPLIDFVGPYPWTTLEIPVALSLIVSAIWMHPGHDEQTES